ncbi:MAG: S-layer homology domain-containing protein [Tissierellia bacterium]|nr:S-layer homology domain-containing protein [Tissierellia bacterium]
MKKIIILSLLLAVVFTSLNVVNVEAQEFSIGLEEPIDENLVIGTNVDYKLNIDLPKNRSNFRNLFVTLRFGQGLDIKNYSLNNGERIEGAGVNVSASPHQKHDYITLKLTNLKDIKTERLVLQIGMGVNDKAPVGSSIANTFSYSYQLQNGTTINVPQIQQYSKTVTGEAINQPEIIEPAPEAPERDPIYPVDSFESGKTPIFMMTGSRYADFMKVVKGYTDPHSIVFVSYLSSKDDVLSTQADANGEFVIDLSNTNTDKPIVIIKAKAKDKEMSNEAIMTYIDQETILYDDLLEFMNNLSILGKRDLAIGLMNRFNSLNFTQSVLASSEPPRQMVYEAYRDLYEAAIAGEVVSGQTIQVTGGHMPFFKGYDDGTFGPERSITRAEVAAILSRIIAQREVEYKPNDFPDVKPKEWYVPYISHLVEIGVMKGYDDGTFKPDQSITRAEFASLLVRYKNLEEMGPNKFTDLDDNYWAAKDIRKATLAGYVTGYPEGDFKPLKNVTRAEAATMMNRVLNRYPDLEFIDANNILPFKDIKRHWAYYYIVEATVEHTPNIVNGREEGWKGTN